jgi:hypothetical protein
MGNIFISKQWTRQEAPALKGILRLSPRSDLNPSLEISKTCSREISAFLCRYDTAGERK